MDLGVGTEGPFRSKLKMPLVLTLVPWVSLHVVTLWTDDPRVLHVQSPLPTATGVLPRRFDGLTAGACLVDGVRIVRCVICLI